MEDSFGRTMLTVVAVGLGCFGLAASFLVVFWFALRSSEEQQRRRWLGTVPRLALLVASLLAASGVLFWIALG